MKTKLLLLFVALSMGAYAQGNLQFNQVLTYTVNSTQANVYTVPAGKVAKIVKAIEKSNSEPYRAEFLINGTGQPLNSSYPSKDGMWLKAGDIIGSSVGTIYDDYIVLSIIEYNIISP